MAKMDIESATLEFNKWLDYKRVKQARREEKEAFGEAIISSIMDGDLIINEKTFIMTYKLLFPILDNKGNEYLSELKFNPRVKVKELNIKLKAVKVEDADGRLLAHAASSCDKNVGELALIDTEDNDIVKSIAGYFL